MKITVKKKTSPLKWEELLIGTIIEGDNGTQAMVYCDEDMPSLLLITPGRLYHLQKVTGMAGYFTEFKITGKVVEIIVEAK